MICGSNREEIRMSTETTVKKEYQALLTPWKIGNCEIKNRFVVTSMGGTNLLGWMERNHFDKAGAKFILKAAKGGAGLVLPGCQPVYNPMFGQWLHTNKKMYRDLAKWMPEFHKTGAKLFVQLTAGFGRSFTISEVMEQLYSNKALRRASKPVMDLDMITASASPAPNRWSDKVPSRALTVEEIRKFVDSFAECARLLKEAGVDGVEIHAVHEGYLLDQFTLKYVNHRTDEYGGSLENRYRFPVEIVQAIKKACGDDFPVSLRYSVVSKTKGFRRGALPGEKFEEAGRDMEESEIAAGRMDPVTAAKAVARGGIDGAGFARQFLADPEWVNKLLEGREDEIRPCILCHNGCFNMAHYKGVPNDQDLFDSLHLARCAVNAEMMQWDKHYVKTAKNPQTVIIVGGGIGGMEAARVLALRGHRPVIYERSDCLGGAFIAAAAESYKGKLRDLLAWYRRQMEDLDIEIHYNYEVRTLQEFGDLPVIVATGAVPRVLRNVAGHEKMIEACEFLLSEPGAVEAAGMDFEAAPVGASKVGKTVAVIGGGLTGCEIAYELQLQGKKPVIIEMMDDLIKQKGVCLANSSYLREYFAWKKVPVYLETRLTEVKDGAVVCVDKDGRSFEIACDSVISCAGYLPAPLAAAGKKNVQIIGDCRSVGNLRTVIWGAYEAAMKV